MGELARRDASERALAIHHLAACGRKSDLHGSDGGREQAGGVEGAEVVHDDGVHVLLRDGDASGWTAQVVAPEEGAAGAVHECRDALGQQDSGGVPSGRRQRLLAEGFHLGAISDRQRLGIVHLGGADDGVGLDAVQPRLDLQTEFKFEI